jgi:hypothetical protein
MVPVTIADAAPTGANTGLNFHNNHAASAVLRVRAGKHQGVIE